MSETLFLASRAAKVRALPTRRLRNISFSHKLTSGHRLVVPILIFFFVSLSSYVDADDFLALAALYNSTNGPYWSSSCRWPATGTPTCTSPGVTCSSDRVTHIRLTSCNITGTLPHQWSSMSALRYMFLESNQLTGTLPHQWSSMSALQYMWLDSNQLTGTLPYQWSRMSALVWMFLGSNQLTGTLPHQWSSMSALVWMQLHSNQLTGTLPHQWSRMPALRDIRLYSNQLIGTLPHEWSSMPALDYMRLESNRLSGTLPHQWSGLSAMQYIRLDSNRLTGTLPHQWQTLQAAAFMASSMDVRYNCLIPLAAWYTVAPYTVSVVVTPVKPDELCIASVSTSDSQSVARTFSISVSHSAAQASLSVSCSAPASFSASGSLMSASLTRTSLSRSAFLSVSVSAMRVATASCTVSPSATATPSASKLRTPTARSTMSSTLTRRSFSRSAFLSVSVSATRVATASCTVSPSATASPSASKSRTQTARSTSLSPTAFSSSAWHSFSTTVSKSGTDSWSLSTLSWSFTPTPTMRATPSATLSQLCDVQLCGLAVPTVNASGPLSSSPLVLLLPAAAGAALMRAAAVPFAATQDAAVLALRLVCGEYPLPLGLRRAVLLHNGAVLDLQEMGADEIVLFLPNITLDAPSWLPAGALPFRTTNAIRIGLTVSCGGDAAFVVTVPVLPESLPALASTTAAVSYAAQWVSAAGGGGAAGSVGRAAAAQRLQLCSGVGASYGGLLGVPIDGVGDAEHSYARGAVGGNAAVLAGAAAALLCLAVVYGAATGSDCRTSLLRVAQPSSLHPVWAATLPTTAAAMPLLVDGNVGYMLLGAAAVLLPMLLLLGLQVSAHNGGLVVVDRALQSDQPRDCTFVGVLTLLRRSVARRWRWEEVASVPPAPSTLLRAAWVVLLDHRVLWYPALDAGVLTATCVLSVVSGMGDVHLCRRAGWAMLALCVGQLCLCVAVRPMTSLASNVHCVSCLLLTCAALLVQCVGLSGKESLPPAAATAAVALQLAVVGLSLVKLLDDVWNVAQSVVRLFTELDMRRRPSQSSTANISEPKVTADANEPEEPNDDHLDLFDWQHLEEGQVVDPYAPEGLPLPPRRLMLFEELAQLEGDNEDSCSSAILV